jgi:GT2 family glycosyltransferase
MTHVSAIVCTRDRSNDLRDTLQGLVAQSYPPESFEIIVVDNDSKDDTPSVVAEFAAASRAPVRYIVEPIPGLSQARNAGARAAAGEVIAYTDDDAIPQPNWLATLADAFHRYDDLGGAGGPIDPLWLPERPVWFPPECIGLLGAMDGGPDFRWISFPESPWGPNIALRKEAYERAGGFYTGLGLVGANLALHEEPDLCARIEGLGYRIAYVPSARVQHKMRAEKVNRRYLRRWCWARGSGHVLLYLRTNHWTTEDLPVQGLCALKTAVDLWQQSLLPTADDPYKTLSAEWEAYSQAGLAAESLRRMAPESAIAATLERVPHTLASLKESEAGDYPGAILSALIQGYEAIVSKPYTASVETRKYHRELKALLVATSRQSSVATVWAELRKGHFMRAASATMQAIRSGAVGAALRKVTWLS